MKPFSRVELVQPNAMQKILKINPPENALKELINILATKPYEQISANDLEEISKKYKVNLAEKFYEDRAKILVDFANHYLNLDLPNEGSVFIPKLAQLLGFDKKTADEVLLNTRTDILRVRYRLAIQNRRLTDEDDAKLDKLIADLGLSKVDVDKVSEEVRRDILQSYINSIIADGEISPEEYQELEASAKSLKVKMILEDDSQRALYKMRLIWAINHMPLPTIDAEINLKRGELCYYKTFVDWYETRVISQNVVYAGFTGSIRIVKGIRYRYGNLNVSRRPTEEGFVKIDNGVFYITNSRLIFIGRKKTTTIQISHILNIQTFTNGIGIIKDSGKSPFLAVDRDIDILIATLMRVISDCL